MSAILKFTDYNNTINVSYKTNLINNTDNNFTVSEVVGLSDAEVTFGLNFKQLVYTVEAFKTFALVNGLKLVKITNSAITVIKDFEGSTYYGNGLGVDGI